MKTIFKSFMATVFAALTFTACEDVPAPYAQPVSNPDSQEATIGNGTEDEPLTVTQAISKAAGTGNWITGYIVGANSGADEYKFITDASEVQIASNIYIAETPDETDEKKCMPIQLPAGDVRNALNLKDNPGNMGKQVVLYGNIENYFSQPGLKSVSYAKIGGNEYGTKPSGENDSELTGEATGDGSLANPFNAVAAAKYAMSLGKDVASTDKFYIKGKVANISEQYGTQYGNATFTISDDGESSTFTIYRALYLGNQKYTSGDLLAKGDDVVVYGKIVNYRGDTPETVTGEAYLYSLNGVTGEGGGEVPVVSGEAKGSGTQADPFNVQAIINFVSGLAADVDTKQDYYVKGIVTSIPNNGISTQYNNVSFYISDDKSAANQFYVFRAKGLNGGDVTENMIKVGDEVVIFGSTWVNYKGNTPETKQGEAYIVSITAGQGGNENPPTEPTSDGSVTKTVEGTTLSLVNTTVTASANTVTVDFGAQGWVNAQDVTELTLEDGTTITLSKGAGSNAPKYYDGTKGLRLYAKNVMTITGSSKAIAKADFTCDSAGGTNYVGNELLSGSASGNTLTIVNEHTGTSGGVQFRPQTLVITYAE